MSGGWTDGRSCMILNFLVAYPQGNTFLKSVDAFSNVKDAQLLFELLDEVVMKVRLKNFV